MSSAKPEQPLPSLVEPREEAAEKIRSRIKEGHKILESDIRSPVALQTAKEKRENWHKYNVELLRRLFDDESISKEYSWPKATRYHRHPPPLSVLAHEFSRGVQDHLNRLQSILERLELIPESRGTRTSRKGQTRPRGTSVFLVHGHDDSARELLRQYLKKLGLHPIVLQDQPGGGRTLREKLESYSDVDFAVVLLTPDDVGRSKESKEARPRARQNVIFELGYFEAKLGRGRVCALYKGVEIPSDYQGVEYIPMDDGGEWKSKLDRELQQAEFDVDLNKPR